MRKITLLMFFMTVVFCCPIFAAEDQVGRYTAVEGRADVIRADSSSAVRISENEPAYLGDIVRTKSNSRVEIVFRDKSVVRLAPQTRVMIEEYVLGEQDKREKASIKLFRGKMRATVSKNGRRSDFHIITPTTSGTVKGTDIFAYYEADSTGILVKEGEMSVCNPLFPDKAMTIRKGECVNVPMNDIPENCREYIEAEMAQHEKDTEPVLSAKTALTGKDVEEMSGMITSCGGQVEVRREGEESWHNAVMKEVLAEGDRIRTGEDGRVEITLDNGNIVNLQANSELLLKTLRKDSKTGQYENVMESEYGKIKAIVEKLGTKSTFKIKTPTAVCGVRGTVMYLNVDPSAGTQVFYEGGDGYVTSLSSGETQDVTAGQNSFVDSVGGISTPSATTDEQRGAIDESWEAPENISDYSESQDAVNPEETGIGIGSEGENGSMDRIVENALNTEMGLEDYLFEDIVFGRDTDDDPAPENANFTAKFGEVGIDGGGKVELIQNDTSSMRGVFAFAVPGAGGTWSGISGAGNSVRGSFSGEGTDRLWGGEDLLYAVSDGGVMMGKVGGALVRGNISGKVLGIYIDTTGHAGTFSSRFDGTASNGTFASDGSMTVKFTERGYVNLAPEDLGANMVDGGDLMDGKGRGDFSGGGTLACTNLGGDAFELNTGADHAEWGIWFMQLEGTYIDPSSSDWKLAIGGQHENTNNPGVRDAWIGTIKGNEWGSDKLIGSFEGIWFGNMGPGTEVCGGAIYNGDLVGAYDEGTMSWEAIGGGEWLEVTELLDEVNLGFTADEFKNFVTVPVSEVYGSGMSGANANMAAHITTHLYANGLNQIWTGNVTGTHSGVINDNWVLNLSNTDGHNMTLTGDRWNNGEWHAIVNGVLTTENVNMTGEAAGKYNDSDGTFGGVAGGTWQ